MTPISCWFGQHNFKPLEFEWVEEFSGTAIHKTSLFSKHGRFKVIKVYCINCGTIKEIAIKNNKAMLRTPKKGE